ncbi:signal recognition particle-docking protein FtsY [Ligilactobacillus sp. LYQ139]|uniref:signal recognition particle-docking protein FtsY n=1 Tax=Ligilactobacillus sp. LYQ139 TaxID=3378800 RepID=UPI0038535717
MGLFDRLKRAFRGTSKETSNQEQEREKQRVSFTETDQGTPVETQSSPEGPAANETPEKVARVSQKQAAPLLEPGKNEKTTTASQNQGQGEEDQSFSAAGLVSKKSCQRSSDESPTSEKKEVADNVEELPGKPTVTEQGSSSTPATETVEEGHYDRGLAKTRHGFGAKLKQLLANFHRVDEDFFDDLEETLIEADVGYEMALKISDALRDEVKFRNAKSKEDVSNAVIERMVEIYDAEGKDEDNTLHFAAVGPTIYLFVGVNGVGKTTTIGKLAHRFKKQGKKVLLAAGDTFRAGAIEQLVAWGDRVGVPVVQKPAGSDPAAVVFDAVKRAKEENYDILLIDTAGRLQNKVNLMKELEKIGRIIKREVPDAPHETLLALDATTGQNALAQAKQFREVTPLTGIILTKLDGTARGGIVLAIRNELHLPVKLVGLGEQMDDLRDFTPEEFVYGLFKGLVTAKIVEDD